MRILNTVAVCAVVFLFAAGCSGSAPSQTQPVATTTAPVGTTTTNIKPAPTPAREESTAPAFVEPLTRALERVTKKKYGIEVSPNSSPVSPERFSGIHTGTDFEILPGEETEDVQVYAVCSGTVLSVQRVSGYGGVFVQSCMKDGSAITVLYGHLRQASVSLKVGQRVDQGRLLGLLGTGYSTETDGERKHLHLSVHKGSVATLAGYVRSKSALSSWIDFETLLTP